jgi:hypothetical protein
MNETLSDLAALGRLEGHRVRLLEDVGSFVAKGATGLVLSVRSDCPRALVRYLSAPDVPWRYQDVESPFCKLALVDDGPKGDCP